MSNLLYLAIKQQLLILLHPLDNVVVLGNDCLHSGCLRLQGAAVCTPQEGAHRCWDGDLKKS